MSKRIIISLIAIAIAIFSLSFRNEGDETYNNTYHASLAHFRTSEQELLALIQRSDINDPAAVERIRTQVQLTRNEMKGLDFWFRYLEPLAYKSINGPLPVEWETEVFEKFEKPYKREGAGLTLAALYLDEDHITKDSLAALIRLSLKATEVYGADSITGELASYHHFYLCNRLFLLNLATIYTTGFECPDTTQIIPELRIMLTSVNHIYKAFNQSFPTTPLTGAYQELYTNAIKFVQSQPAHYSSFDHFSFIRDYVNPLFILNQQLIKEYHVVSHSMVDYALNKSAPSIFSKSLYNGQNAKGVFSRVTDTVELAAIQRVGKLLFYDPILSANNQRSCASCHHPKEYFTDTSVSNALRYDRQGMLERNAPTLINAQYNHLAMLDGKHFTLQHQTKDVITNKEEMNLEEQQVLQKILSCAEYKQAFTRFLKHTPQEPEISFDHIASAITLYYAKFGNGEAPFDLAMNRQQTLDPVAKQGFNLFMSKAQCATCHFAPQFNGVKPPYIGSEFEVLGVPADTGFHKLSADKGRYKVNPATETLHAFRTGTIRNAARTMPYMHNGVFRTLDEVIEFYNNGGGAGRGLAVDNQTLSSDSLKLTMNEKQLLVKFIGSLNEALALEDAPPALPKSKVKALNARKLGGTY